MGDHAAGRVANEVGPQPGRGHGGDDLAEAVVGRLGDGRIERPVTVRIGADDESPAAVDVVDRADGPGVAPVRLGGDRRVGEQDQAGRLGDQVAGRRVVLPFADHAVRGRRSGSDERPDGADQPPAVVVEEVRLVAVRIERGDHPPGCVVRLTGGRGNEVAVDFDINPDLGDDPAGRVVTHGRGVADRVGLRDDAAESVVASRRAVAERVDRCGHTPEGVVHGPRRRAVRAGLGDDPPAAVVPHRRNEDAAILIVARDPLQHAGLGVVAVGRDDAAGVGLGELAARVVVGERGDGAESVGPLDRATLSVVDGRGGADAMRLVREHIGQDGVERRGAAGLQGVGRRQLRDVVDRRRKDRAAGVVRQRFDPLLPNPRSHDAVLRVVLEPRLRAAGIGHRLQAAVPVVGLLGDQAADGLAVHAAGVVVLVLGLDAGSRAMPRRPSVGVVEVRLDRPAGVDDLADAAVIVVQDAADRAVGLLRLDDLAVSRVPPSPDGQNRVVIAAIGNPPDRLAQLPARVVVGEHGDEPVERGRRLQPALVVVGELPLAPDRDRRAAIERLPVVLVDLLDDAAVRVGPVGD